MKADGAGFQQAGPGFLAQNPPTAGLGGAFPQQQVCLYLPLNPTFCRQKNRDIIFECDSTKNFECFNYWYDNDISIFISEVSIEKRFYPNK